MSPKIDTVVQFSGLKSGRYEYCYALDNSFFEGYENEELREGNVDFKVVLERREQMLLFTFTFHGVVKTTCDRCLGEMEVPVEGEENKLQVRMQVLCLNGKQEKLIKGTTEVTVS